MGMVNKTLRLQKLNELLKHNDGYTIIDLQVLLDVEERTVRKDLTLIQSEPYNAKLVTDLYRGRMRVYKYQDTNYDLPLFKKHDGLKEKMNEVVSFLSEYGGLPQYEWLKACLMAIESDTLADIKGIMSFENNAELKGLDFIQPLIDAIRHKYPIKLTYQPYGKEERTINVQPYHIKQFNNRWFLIGCPEKAYVLHNYALDRITDIEHLSKDYIETDVDFNEYFDDVIGVTVNDVETSVIELLVSRERFPYIETKPLHWTQKHLKEKDTDDYVFVTIEVKPNKELITLLLSFGADLIVVSPKYVREEIAEGITKLYKQLLLSDKS